MLSISKERFYVKIKSFSQIAAHKQTTNQLNKFFIARTALYVRIFPNHKSSSSMCSDTQRRPNKVPSSRCPPTAVLEMGCKKTSGRDNFFLFPLAQLLTIYLCKQPLRLCGGRTPNPLLPPLLPLFRGRSSGGGLLLLSTEKTQICKLRKKVHLHAGRQKVDHKTRPPYIS